MAVSFPIRTRVKAVAEARGFVFDFSEFPEIAQDGLTIQSLAAPAVSGLTLGTPTATAADVEEDGHTIPIGEGAVLPISGGVANTDYTVEVRATLSDGTTILGVRGIIAVR